MPSSQKPSRPSEEQSAILQALLEAAVDSIITIDQRGVIKSANAAVEKMFGYSIEELLGQNISLLMPSPIRQEHDQYLSNYLDSGQAQIIGIGREVTAIHKNGSPVEVDLAVNEVRIGDEILFTGILRDMTARNLARDSARRERTFANNLVETANAIIVVLDTDGNIARINPFMEQLSGHKLQEIRGKNWFELFIPEEEREQQQKIFKGILKGNSIRSHRSSIVTRDQKIRTITWSGRVLHDADDVGEGMLAIGNDITELQAAEKQIIAQERLAAIGQMVTGLAHESRNALQRAQAAMDVLELDAEADSLRMVRQAQAAIQELQKLYEEVRNYAAPIILEVSACDIIKLCQLTWEQVRGTEPDVDTDLVIHADASEVEVTCDHLRMRQVIRNILENAVCVAPPQSKILLDVQLTAEHTVQLKMTDEGPGLSEEQLESIFVPFFTTKTKGTGLGMAIAERIILAHGGQITAANHPEKGAQIELRLPLQK